MRVFVVAVSSTLLSTFRIAFGDVVSGTFRRATNNQNASAAAVKFRDSNLANSSMSFSFDVIN